MFRLLPSLTVLCLTLPACCSQASGPATGAQTSQDTATAPLTITKPTDLLAPAIDGLSRSVRQTHLERWNRSVRDETDSNLRSIERDLQNTLPPLLQTADAAPSSVAASLPVLRNVNALVAVLVRVTVTAQGTAPGNESQALSSALTVLEGARRSLDDQMEQLATAQEKQIADLQGTVKTQAATLATQTPAALPPAPTAKAKRTRKPSKPQ